MAKESLTIWRGNHFSEAAGKEKATLREGVGAKHRFLDNLRRFREGEDSVNRVM